jgi:triosephosphate isomerase
VPEEGLTQELMGCFGETDASVNLKAQEIIAAGLRPIICVGETLQERQEGHTDTVVRRQTARAVRDLASEQVASQVVFAYEPVWAIGTGEVCPADEADRVCGVVRAAIRDIYDEATADQVRVQYGGSMKPDNARELLTKSNIDGGLIGGASLKAADFAGIIGATG